MTTTCQAIVDSAKAFSGLNSPLVGNAGEMLTRIKADQQAVFSEYASVTRDRFQRLAVIASTNGAALRVFDLSTLTPPVERVLLVTLADGREASQVDVLDVDAELAPRYIVRGQTLIEVLSDWGVVGIINANLVYVYGATVIDPAGALTQLVSLPDEWVDLLVIPLGMYLFQKDPGRDPAEYARLEQLLSDRTTAFVDYLTNYGGVEVKRFTQPTPQRSSQKK